jgi:hypothetical protein
MLALGFADWTYWADFSPPLFLGPQKVTFDGVNKLILVNEGVTSLDVKVDIYGGWKEWLKDPNHVTAIYARAISYLGGDPITASTSVGITYFLENGWRIKPYLGDYVLDISGNLYTREPGANPIVPTSGVSTSLTRSNLVDFVDASISQESLDIINANIGTILPEIELARDHSRAANQQTQK